MAFNPTVILLSGGELPPLYEALSQRDFETASELLSRGARLDDLVEENGDTFLHEAAEKNDLRMVDFFLSHHCPISLESFDEIERTPLICAAANGRREVVARLLAAGADPNAHDEERIGTTAILEAVREGHKKIVGLLLSAGADPTISGWMNLSAVDHAWHSVRGDHQTIREIRSMLGKFPSGLRDREIRSKKER